MDQPAPISAAPMPDPGGTRPRSRLTVPVLAFGGILMAVMQTVVVPLLPDLPRLTGASPGTVSFRAQVTERLADRLTGPDAALRAELAVGSLVGLGVMYGIARGERLRASAVDDIVDRYGPVVQALLTS